MIIIVAYTVTSLWWVFDSKLGTIHGLTIIVHWDTVETEVTENPSRFDTNWGTVFSSSN